MMNIPVLLLLTPLVSAGLMRASNNLLNLDPTVDVSNILACQGVEVKECVAATVNLDALNNPEQDSIILPTGDELFKKTFLQTYGERNIDVLGDFPASFKYKNDAGAEAVLTWNANSLYGKVQLGDRSTYLIEKYNDKYILWMEIDQRMFNDESSRMMAEKQSMDLPHMRMDELLAQGRADRQSVVEYTVTVYYTRGFKASTADPITFIDQAIAETNEGYINSNIPLRVKLHCTVESDIPDNLSADDTIDRFARLHSDNNEIRKSADTAILLVQAFNQRNVCGINNFDEISSGDTIGVVKKSCATGYYSFGHEIGHGLGLRHNRAAASSKTSMTQPYAYGYIIKSGKYRSIMAYNSPAGEDRVNYYSSPEIFYKGTWVTGTTNDDNARVLTDNRFAAAKIGDESMRCPGNVRSASPSGCVDLWDNWKCAEIAEKGFCPMFNSCDKTCGYC